MIRTFCDACDQDITEAGPMPAWRIRLEVERIPNGTDFEYSVHVPPPARSGIFCSLSCLTDRLAAVK